MTTINGTSGNDVLSSSNSGDVINGLGGDDYVSAGGGSYVITMAAGNDTVTVTGGSTAAVNIYGGDGNNNIYLDSGNLTYKGGVGAETIYHSGVAGSDSIITGDGEKQITTTGGYIYFSTTTHGVTAGNGVHYINLGGGQNTVTLGNGDATINSAGAPGSNASAVGDRISVGTGNHGYSVGSGYHYYSALDGDNIVSGGNGGTVRLGVGNSSVGLGDYGSTVTAAGGNNTVSLGASAHTNVLQTINSVTTGAGNDSITITIASNFTGSQVPATGIDSGAGDDTIVVTGPLVGGVSIKAGDGNNTVNATGGQISYISGNGNESISLVAGGIGTHVVTTGDGDKYISTVFSAPGYPNSGYTSQFITAGNGNHTVAVTGNSGPGAVGAFINVHVGDGDSWLGFQAGGAVTGAGFFSKGGNDTIVGTNGAMTIDSGSGDDQISFGTGTNTFTFTKASVSNHDVVYSYTTLVTVKLVGLSTYTLINNTDGSHTYYFDIDNTLTIYGTLPHFAVQPYTVTTFTLSAGNQTITGSAGDDIIDGGVIDGLNTANTTFLPTTVIDGGAGVDTLLLTIQGAATGLPASATPGVPIVSNVEIVTVDPQVDLISGDLSIFSGITDFNINTVPGTNVSVTNLAKGAAYGLIGDGVASSSAAYSLGYDATATKATLNLMSGVHVSTVVISGAGVQSTVINSGDFKGHTIGVIQDAPSSQSLTINATANLTTTLVTGATKTLTITGIGVVDLDGTAGAPVALSNTITTIDASGLTTGGVHIQAGNSTSLKFTGGGGDDIFSAGAVLGAGAAVTGGGGFDILVLNSSAQAGATAASKYSAFTALEIGGATSVNFDNFVANNSIWQVRVTAGASPTFTNLGAGTEVHILGDVTTATLNYKGATTVGQFDAMALTFTDDLAATNTITVGKLTSSGLESLAVTAVDNGVINSLAGATSLTAIYAQGAGDVTLRTSTMALKAGFTVDATSETGLFTFDATNSTSNGFTLTGGTGGNIITGGKQKFSVNFGNSMDDSDTVAISSATGGSITAPNALVYYFGNSATSADTVDLIGTATIAADVTNKSTSVANLTASITSGIVTFGGTLAPTATLTQKIQAIFSTNILGPTQYNAVAFEDAGSTYVVEQGNTTVGFNGGTDVIVQLVGTTGFTSVSTAPHPVSGVPLDVLYIA